MCQGNFVHKVSLRDYLLHLIKKTKKRILLGVLGASEERGCVFPLKALSPGVIQLVGWMRDQLERLEDAVGNLQADLL